MLKIVAVDVNAESRGSLLARLHALIDSAGQYLEVLPPIDLSSRSLEELRFRDSPALCIIGPDLLESNLSLVGSLRSRLPESALIACLRTELGDLSTIEQLGRYGVDDTMTLGTPPAEFLRKLVLLARKSRKTKSGKLIVVDSGKGGLGVTTIAAALADALVSREHRVTLVDFDVETQALSRYVQARPFLNENLQLLFEKQRPVSEEFVEQCLISLWEHGQGSLMCLTPPPDSDELHSHSSGAARILLSLLEVIDSRSDFVIVDTGRARGALLRTLYRVADKAIFITANDPAALYSSTDRFSRMRGCLATGAEAALVTNAASIRGLKSASLMSEFSRVAGVRAAEWVDTAIPYCPAGQRWPGSGGTLYSLGGRAVRKSIERVLAHLALVSDPLRPADEKLLSPAHRTMATVRAAMLKARHPDLLPPAVPRSSPHSGLPRPARMLEAPEPAAASEAEEAKRLITPAVIS